MKRPKIGLTIAMIILTTFLLILVFFISFATDKNKTLHLGDYYFTEYYDGDVVKQKGSAVMIKKDNTPEVTDAVLVRTEDGLRVLFVKSVDDDTVYLNDINGDISEAVSISRDLIGKVEFYVPLLGYLISFVNSPYSIYLLLGFIVLIVVLFGILISMIMQMNNSMETDNQVNENEEAFDDDLNTEEEDVKKVDEVFKVFFNIDYTMSETKSLVKMILNANSEKLKVGVIGERKQLVIDAIKGYLNNSGISNVKLSETGVFSYIECEKDFTVTLCSIILNLKIKLSESERDTDA